MTGSLGKNIEFRTALQTLGTQCFSACRFCVALRLTPVAAYLSGLATSNHGNQENDLFTALQKMHLFFFLYFMSAENVRKTEVPRSNKGLCLPLPWNRLDLSSGLPEEE